MKSKDLQADQNWDAMVDKVTKQSDSFDQANKLIYQWFKQNKITHNQYLDLKLEAFKWWS